MLQEASDSQSECFETFAALYLVLAQKLQAEPHLGMLIAVPAALMEENQATLGSAGLG